MMPIGDVAPELALLSGAVAILIFALFTARRLQRWAALLAIVTLCISASLTISILERAPRMTFGDTYAIDGTALVSKFIVIGVTILVVLFSIEWFAADPRAGEYYALLLMSALGAVLLAGAADSMEIVLALLLSSATGYVLVSYHRRSRRAAEAGMKYYLLGALTNAAMLYGIVLLFGVSRTTTLAGMHRAFEASPAPAVPLVAAAALTVVGLAFKIGAVPAHAWMPDVADGAPAPIAAFVTAAPKIGALVALARIVVMLPEELSGWRPLIALLSALTRSLGNVAALWQEDVRRLLGWSAVSQSGYAMMAVVALNRSSLAVPSLLFFLAAYVLGNLAAFGVVIELRGLADRERYTGLGRSHPLLGIALVTSFLSFVGIPPLAGFTGKLALFGAAIDAGYGWLALLAAVNTVLSLAYYARVIGPMYFGVNAGVSAMTAERSIPVPLGSWASIGVAISTAGLLILGVGGNLVLGAFQSPLLPR